jgi:hypothetical protein
MYLSRAESSYFVLYALQEGDTLRTRVPASIGAITILLGRNFIYGNMIGVEKAGEFSGRKEGINTSHYSFPNMSLNRSYRACVHFFKRVRRYYRNKNL